MVMFRKTHVLQEIIVVFGILLILVGCAAKSNIVTLSNDQQAAKVKGKVVSIGFETGIMVLKTGRGEEVVFTYTDSTVKMNFGSMGEIKKGKPLEVVYLSSSNANNAVSIKKLQEASCN